MRLNFIEIVNRDNLQELLTFKFPAWEFRINIRWKKLPNWNTSRSNMVTRHIKCPKNPVSFHT